MSACVNLSHGRSAALPIKAIALSLGLLLLISPLAYGAEINVGRANPPADGPPGFVYEFLPDAAEHGLLVLEELFGPDESVFELTISGDNGEAPSITLSKDVTNDTGSTWFGFDISIPSGDNTFALGTATSDTMTLFSESATLLEFREPDPVPDGATVNFTFGLILDGPFNLNLNQTAIVPEPTSMLLGAMGFALVIPFVRRLRRG